MILLARQVPRTQAAHSLTSSQPPHSEQWEKDGWNEEGYSSLQFEDTAVGAVGALFVGRALTSLQPEPQHLAGLSLRDLAREALRVLQKTLAS